jgi:hypothetical protein
MSKSYWRLSAALIILTVAGALLAWSLLPGPRVVRRQSLQPAEMQLPGSQAASPETRLLTLDYPASLRAGDGERVALGFAPQTVVELPASVFADYNILAEARLELAGVQVQPAATVSEPLLPGQKVVFYWSVRAEKAGQYPGTLWFYLRYVPKAGGPEVRQLLSAQPLEIRVTTLLGVVPGLWRGLGLLGLFGGALLGFPFLERALVWLWLRIRQRGG